MKTNQKPLSVFLVDDDKMFLSSLKYDLNRKFKSAIHTTAFTSGEECLQHLQQHPDIVVLDYYLNDGEHPDAMNGFQVMKKIKDTLKDTTVIIISGQNKLQLALDAIKNGAYEYIAKSDNVFTKVENVLKNVIDRVRTINTGKDYEKWNFVAGAFFLALIVADIIYYITR